MKANHNFISVSAMERITISNISKILNESKSQPDASGTLLTSNYFQYFKDTK